MRPVIVIGGEESVSNDMPHPSTAPRGQHEHEAFPTQLPGPPNTQSSSDPHKMQPPGAPPFSTYLPQASPPSTHRYPAPPPLLAPTCPWAA